MSLKATYIAFNSIGVCPFHYVMIVSGLPYLDIFADFLGEKCYFTVHRIGN